MKKKITLAALIASVSMLSAQIVSVGSYDLSDNLIDNFITSDTTWGDDETIVVLNGPIFVKDDATLEILPGTVVRGQPRSESRLPGSLIITKSGRIEADGLSDSPIIFTTAALDTNSDGIPDSTGGFLDRWNSNPSTDFYDENPATAPLGLTANGTIAGNIVDSSELTGMIDNDNTQLWGGLVILGEAPTNLGDGSANGSNPNIKAGFGFVEGLTNGDDTEYGGSVANDDSGILRYVSVRHGGDEIGTGNEINGITLAGVGFGTTIEYCEVYLNYDDGFEWFGGTVNGNHLVASFVGDDSFDGDQGWIGQVQFAFVVQSHITIGVSGGDEAFEFDGDDSPDINEDLDGNIVPLPSYAFANFTIVGPTGASNRDTSAKANGRITLRNGFVGDLYNGYVVNCTGSFLSWSGTSALIDTVTVDDSTDTTVPSGANLVTANIVLPASASGLLSENQDVVGGLNPRPITGLSVNGIGSTISLPAPFDNTVDYVGAFPTSPSLNLWTKGWTALNRRGVLVD